LPRWPHRQEVPQAPVPELIAFGLDVTLRCTLPAAECRARFAEGPLAVVGEMAEVWFRQRDRITFHDPLAAAALFEPDLCEYRQGKVLVELVSPHVSGMTHWREDPDGPHTIAVNVDPQAILHALFRDLRRLNMSAPLKMPAPTGFPSVTLGRSRHHLEQPLDLDPAPYERA
jgi:inosine-uridine nucleoside N-ribohydrolase